jgi:hypothetical protein
MSLTVGYKDLKQLRSTLANSAQQIDPVVDQLKGLSIAPDLKADEVAALKKAVEVGIKLQLRREFPILERVVDNLLSRLQTGEDLKPLTTVESRALVDLLGSLSDAENEALNYLRGAGLIREADWKDVVEPHRAESNKIQRTEVKKVKWGLAVGANGLAPAVAAISLSMLIPGIGGAIGAVAMATGMGLAVTPKIHEKINVSSRIEGRALGMNVIEGRETMSELVLLAARVADGDVFKGNIQENVEREVALGNLLLESRGRAGIQTGAYEGEFRDMARDYHMGLAGIAEQNATTPMDGGAMRKEIYDLRAGLMAPEKVTPLVQLVGAINIPTDTDTRVMVAHRQVANLFKLLGEQAAAGGPEAQGTAIYLNHALPLLDDEVQGAVTSVMRNLVSKIGKGEVLTAEDKALLKDCGVELSRIADAKIERDGLDYGRAEDRAREVLAVMLEQVLPSFGEEMGDPKFRDVRAFGEDGGFTVKGAFKSGLFSNEGSFELKLHRDGTVDMDSFKLDVGPKRARTVAEAAAKEAASMLLGRAASVSVNGISGGGDKNYVADVSIDGKRAKVEVTPMGLVDWSSIKV